MVIRRTMLAIVTAVAMLASSVMPAYAAGGREEWQKAVRYFRAEEYEAALPYFRKAYTLSGKRPSAIVGLAQCLRQMKQYEEALAYFEEYVAVKPPPRDVEDVRGTVELMKDLIASQKERTDALDGALSKLDDKPKTATAAQPVPKPAAPEDTGPPPVPAPAVTPPVPEPVKADAPPETTAPPPIPATPPVATPDRSGDADRTEPASRADEPVKTDVAPEPATDPRAKDSPSVGSSEPTTGVKEGAGGESALSDPPAPSVTDQQWQQWDAEPAAAESGLGGTLWIVAIVLIATGAALGSYLYLDGGQYGGSTGVVFDPAE